MTAAAGSHRADRDGAARRLAPAGRGPSADACRGRELARGQPIDDEVVRRPETASGHRGRSLATGAPDHGPEVVAPSRSWASPVWIAIRTRSSARVRPAAAAAAGRRGRRDRVRRARNAPTTLSPSPCSTGRTPPWRRSHRGSRSAGIASAIASGAGSHCRVDPRRRSAGTSPCRRAARSSSRSPCRSAAIRHPISSAGPAPGHGWAPMLSRPDPLVDRRHGATVRSIGAHYICHLAYMCGHAAGIGRQGAAPGPGRRQGVPSRAVAGATRPFGPCPACPSPQGSRYAR